MKAGATSFGQRRKRLLAKSAKCSKPCYVNITIACISVVEGFVKVKKNLALQSNIY